MADQASDAACGDESALVYEIPEDIILIQRLWPVTKKAFSIQLLLHRMGGMRPSDYKRAQKTIVALDKGTPYR